MASIHKQLVENRKVSLKGQSLDRYLLSSSVNIWAGRKLRRTCWSSWSVSMDVVT